MEESTHWDVNMKNGLNSLLYLSAYWTLRKAWLHLNFSQ